MKRKKKVKKSVARREKPVHTFSIFLVFCLLGMFAAYLFVPRIHSPIKACSPETKLACIPPTLTP
jgi:hypothetical protein